MSTNTKYDFSMFEDKSTDKYDFSMFDVKKKDFSQEELEAAKTSLQGYSEVPSPLEYEAPSTTTKEEAPGVAIVSGEELGLEDQPKQLSEQDVAVGKIQASVNDWYRKRGGLTPQEKLATFDRIIRQKKSQYEQNIQSNPDQAESLVKQYNEDVDRIKENYGIIEKDGSFTVADHEIKQYQEVLQDSYKSYIDDMTKASKDPFMRKLGMKLDAMSERYLNIPIDVLALSEAVTNAISEKLGGGTSTYWQDRAFYLSEKANEKSAKARIGSGEIVAALQTGDTGEALGNLVLNIAEQVPQLALLATGNAAGLKNFSLGLIGGQVATEKFVQNKEMGVPDWINAINSITSGGLELVTEELGSVQIMNNIKQAYKVSGKEVLQDNIAKSMMHPFERAYLSLGKAVDPSLREGLSEGINQLAGQVVDKYTIDPDVQIGEGVADIIVSSAVIGGAMHYAGAVGLEMNKEKVREAYMQVPNDYSAANKLQATELILQIDYLKEQIKGKNKVFTRKTTEKINELNNQLLDIADREDKATEINDQIAELDKEIALAEEQGKPTEEFEKQQQELIKQRDDILTPKENIPEGVEARQILTEMVEPTKTIPVEKEALKTDILQHKNIKDIKETLQGEKRDNDADVGRRSVGKNEILENKAKDLEIQIKNLRDENGNIPKENLAKFEKLKDQINKLRRGLETTDQVKERVDKFSSDEMLVSTLSGKNTLSPDELSIISDKMRQEGFSQDDIDYIFEDRGDKNKIYNRYYERAKNRGKYYAKEQQSRTLREQGVEVGEVEGVSDKDMPEIDRTKLQDGEEIKEELAPKDQFKKDFLSDEVNLNQIDVPLNMKERKAARKNLLEGKVTKQAQILEDYINKSFEKGNLDLVAIAAGGGTVRTQAPITSIVKGEIVTEPPTVEQPKVEKPKVEKITKEQVVPEIGVRKMGERVMKSKVLDKEFKTDLAEKGIKYAVRGRRVTDSEANEIAKIYKDSNDLNGLKSVILDKTNGIKGDTRTALAVGYYNEIKKLEDSTTDPVQKSKYKQDRVDIYYSEMNTSTDVAQDLQSKRRWVEITSDDPEVMKEANRRDVERRNGDFLEKNKGSIKNAKKLLDTIFESEEFKEDVEKKVKERFDKYVGSLKQSADRRARGQAKVASGLDKLASAIGAKKNLLTENQVDENIYKAVLEIADGLLDITVASTQDLINKIKSATREYLSQKDIDAIADKIIQDTDAANRIGKPVKKEFTDEDIKRIADKLKNKLEDLTPKQVRNILKDYIDEFERLGYVSDAAFNNIYAKALGKEYVSPQDEQLIEDAAKQINEAKKVKNNIETLFDELVNEENSENPDAKKIKELENEINRQAKIYKDEFQKAQIARKKLSNVLSDPRTVYGHIATILKLNLMAFTSFIVNWTANITSMAIRFPTYYISNVLDYGAYSLGFAKERMLPKIDKSKYPSLYKIIDSLPDKKMTYDSLAFSKGFVKGFGEGARQSMVQMITGMLPEDLTGKDLYRSMQPIMAWIDNYNMLTGKKKAEAKEVILNLIEGTLGINPELAARILNMGDKPFREGGKRGRLEEIAKLKKLKGNEKKRFMMYPDPESLADAEEMGKKMALQQENFITDLLDVIRKFGKKGADKIQNKFLRDQVNGLMYLIETIIQPFTKTPTNYLTEGFTFALPEMSIALGTFKALSGDRRAVADYFARAIVGVALRRSVQTLIGLGIMSLAAGGEEDDPNKRSRLKNAAWEDRGSYTINWSAFDRYLQGEDPTWKDGDIKTSYQPFGIMSMVAMANAKAFEGSTQYEIEKQLEEKGYKGLLSDPIGVSGVTVRSALDQSFLKGQYGFMKALMEGGDEADKFTVQLTKELGAIIVPNWYTSIARWEDNYIREVKENYVEDGALKREIVNNYKVSFGVSPEDLPAKLSIYGDDVNRFDNKSLWNIIDPFKTEKFNTGLGTELVELYRKTKNIGVIPQNPKDILNFEIFTGDEGKVSVKLSNKLYYEYAKPLIKAKISRIKAEMNGIDYELGNDVEKAELIEKINTTFMQSGEAKFIKEEFIMKNYDKLVELYSKQKKK